MSTHAIRLVEISLTAAEARRNAPVVTSWLLARGVTTPNPDRDLMAPSEFRAGPRRLPTLKLAVPSDEVSLRTDMSIYGVHALPVTW